MFGEPRSHIAIAAGGFAGLIEGLLTQPTAAARVSIANVSW